MLSLKNHDFSQFGCIFEGMKIELPLYPYVSTSYSTHKRLFYAFSELYKHKGIILFILSSKNHDFSQFGGIFAGMKIERPL